MGVAIGDIGGGDNDTLPPRPRSNRSATNKGWYIAPSSTQCATNMEREQSRMNIFTIIGVVVVVILVAGYFGVHGVNF